MYKPGLSSTSMYLPYNLPLFELLLPSPGKSITETVNFIINVGFK